MKHFYCTTCGNTITYLACKAVTMVVDMLVAQPCGHQLNLDTIQQHLDDIPAIPENEAIIAALLRYKGTIITGGSDIWTRK